MIGAQNTSLFNSLQIDLCIFLIIRTHYPYKSTIFASAKKSNHAFMLLQTNNLTFAYTPQVSFNFPDINCEKGQPFLILGESGKGKTTLLHLLAGLLKAQAGRIQIANTDIAKLSTSQLDKFRGKNIGIIYQKSHFVQSLNVKNNLLLAQYLAGVKQEVSRIKSLLNRLNIGDKLHRKTFELSQGEQQRVAIARALLNQPQIILADEPTASLDDKNCHQVALLLQEQAQEANASLVIVTHDARLKQYFDQHIQL